MWLQSILRTVYEESLLTVEIKSSNIHERTRNTNRLAREAIDGQARNTKHENNKQRQSATFKIQRMRWQHSHTCKRKIPHSLANSPPTLMFSQLQVVECWESINLHDDETFATVNVEKWHCFYRLLPRFPNAPAPWLTKHDRQDLILQRNPHLQE